MGSVQEPISVSKEMASEDRDVEMQDGDAADGGANGVPSNANEASPGDLHADKHVTNGHLTSDEKIDEEARPTGDDAQDTSMPVASVERDEEGSPSTAAEQEVTAAPEVNHNNQVSPTQQRQATTQDTKAQATSKSIRFDKDAARLRELLDEISPQAAQKVLREKWRLFIFDQYDESHISFILRAGFKNANHSVIEKVTRDEGIFKDAFLEIASAKPAVIENVIANATVPQLNHVPQRVLDKAIVERIQSVSAKQLIKWLAEADRLGYKLDDIIDEDDESVVPNLSRAESQDADMMDEVFEVEPRYQVPHYTQYPAHQHQAPPPLASANRDPLLEQQERHIASVREAQLSSNAAATQAQAVRHRKRQLQHQPNFDNRPQAAEADGRADELKCPHCSAVMPHMSGYTYHISKQFCVKKPQDVRNSPYVCDNCMQRFTQHGGLNYHNMNNVCKGGSGAAKSQSVQVAQGARASQLNNAVQPPPRPALTSQLPPPHSIPGQHQPPYQPQDHPGRPPVTIQRPPLHTPGATQSTPVSTPVSRKFARDEIRLSPSELSPAALAAMEKDLNDADIDYRSKVAALDPSLPPDQRALKMVSLKNGIQSRKSTIRKAHGVSLRMRDKDKQARKAAGITPMPSTLHSMSTATSANVSSPLSGPPVSSFSPVNAPAARSAPVPSDYGRPGNPPHPSAASTYNGSSSGHPPPPYNPSRYTGSPLASNAPTSYGTSHHAHPSDPSRYTGPPVASTSGSYASVPSGARPTIRNHTPYQDHNPNTLTHVGTTAASSAPTGFGVLKLDSNRHPAGTSPYTNHKRRRSPDDQGGRQARAPIETEMQQIRAEVASAKMARRTPLAEGQAQSDRDTPMSDGPPPTGVARPAVVRSPTNTKDTAITILDSSDDEDEIAARRVSSVQPRSPTQARSPVQSRSPQTVRSPVIPPSASRTSQPAEKAKEKEQPRGKEILDGDSTESDSDSDIPAQRQTRSTAESAAVKRGFMARRGGRRD